MLLNDDTSGINSCIQQNFNINQAIYFPELSLVLFEKVKKVYLVELKTFVHERQGNRLIVNNIHTL